MFKSNIPNGNVAVETQSAPIKKIPELGIFGYDLKDLRNYFESDYEIAQFLLKEHPLEEIESVNLMCDQIFSYEPPFWCHELYYIIFYAAKRNNGVIPENFMFNNRNSWKTKPLYDYTF
jgi:hypothetical protein